MLKKLILTFAFLTIFTTFYGLNAPLDTSVSPNDNMALRSDDHSLLPDGAYAISAYDNIIRSVGEKEGCDWRLLSAIAYHESRFLPDVVSRRGARGLMQIMPAVARQFNVPTESVSDPATNVWLATQVIDKISRSFRFPQGTPARDRISIILASYNGGVGHVSDARRLAVLHGENPNSWEVVAHYLKLKSDPAYYESEVVKSGKFTGSNQTLAYVRSVTGRYDKYCRMTAE